MEVDRKTFVAGPKSAAPSSEARADALEEVMMKQLSKPGGAAQGVRRGTGLLFGGLTPGGLPLALDPLAPLPPKPTLEDFYRLRFSPHTVTHMLQSATDALKKGELGDSLSPGAALLPGPLGGIRVS